MAGGINEAYGRVEFRWVIDGAYRFVQKSTVDGRRTVEFWHLTIYKYTHVRIGIGITNLANARRFQISK